MILPDLKKYPTVLNIHQIDEIFEAILAQFDKTNQFDDKNELLSYLIDVIHSKGYRPDEHLREDLARGILKYLDFWWDESETELCESITTLAANLDLPDALYFLQKRLITTEDPNIKKEISDTINEIKSLKTNTSF